MSDTVKHPIALAFGGIAFAFLVGEIVMRIYGGVFFSTDNFLESEIHLFRSSYPSIHDTQLGWIPHAPERPTPNASGTTVTVIEGGIRSNGGPPPPGSESKQTILAVGDSMTWGDEVSDAESWPAVLERLTGQRVINAGVAGYGFDQTVLRAEIEVPKYRPGLLIVSLIPDDIARNELSSRTGVGKPYFDLEDGQLVLKNVPVPQPVVTYRPGLVRGALGHSYLVNFAATLLIPGMWLRGKPDYMIAETRVHHHGLEVALALIPRLVALKNTYGVHILVMLQHGRDSSDVEFANGIKLMNAAREAGLDGFDLGPALAAVFKATPKKWDEMFLFFHMSALGNEWLAKQLAPIVRKVASEP